MAITVARQLRVGYRDLWFRRGKQLAELRIALGTGPRVRMDQDLGGRPLDE